MANTNLANAKNAKNDEFYTQYPDIQKEINAYLDYNPNVFRGKTVLLPCDDPEWSNFTRFFAQNFERLGLKRLISTSYAVESKKYKNYQPTLFETESPWFDIDKTRIKGKIFELTHDTNQNGRIDIDDLEWHYLEGDGDFRSKEVCQLRDEADIIVTNPPFSLFREFIAWVLQAKKSFLILGNFNAVHYKEVFPLIQNNTIWIGNKSFGGGMDMIMPKELFDSSKVKKYYVDERGNFIQNIMGVIWYTNIEHGRRHEYLNLMTMNDNCRFGKNKTLQARGYVHYDNYDAIDVPAIECIPSDYEGIMGVPDAFLGRYCPEQFEIIGLGAGDLAKEIGITKNYRGRTDLAYTDPQTGKASCPYSRILIRKKQ